MTSPETIESDPAVVQALNADASILMKEGIRLIGSAEPGAVATALDRFDRALAIRRRLPLDTDPLLRYGLAACWLNRADALMRLRDQAQIAVALEAYDAGIALLDTLPMGEDARFPRRLAIAQQNRGLALQARGGAAVPEAIAAFQTALGVLEGADAAGITDRDYLAAAVWVNVGSAYVAAGTRESAALARDAALRALAFVAPLEQQDADAAEVAVRGRHVICQTLALSIASLEPSADEPGGIPGAVHEATDLVDEGLSLVRGWEQRGVTRFRELAFDLFRFGARLYGWYQPQFLVEFVQDNLDSGLSSDDYVASPPMQAAAREALGLLRPAEGDAERR